MTVAVDGGSVPVHQLLVYPVVDNDMNNASYQRNANAKPLNKPMMAWFFKHYAADPKSPYALPMKAASLKGLPPATIVAAEIDPLLTEGKAYADKLKKDGVKVDYKEYSGVESQGCRAVCGRRPEEGFRRQALNNSFSVCAGRPREALRRFFYAGLAPQALNWRLRRPSSPQYKIHTCNSNSPSPTKNSTTSTTSCCPSAARKAR